MQRLHEEISSEDIEKIVDHAVRRIEQALERLDLSMDYIAAVLAGEHPYDVGMRQTVMGRAGSAGDHPGRSAGSEN